MRGEERWGRVRKDEDQYTKAASEQILKPDELTPMNFEPSSSPRRSIHP